MTPAALVALLALSAPGHHDDDLTCSASVMASFDRLDNALRHLDDELATEHGRERQHQREDLAQAMEQAQKARIEACRGSRVVVEPKPRPIAVLDEAADRSLTQAVRHESFDDGKLSVLTLGTRGVCVTSLQAKALVQELTFSRPRVDAVRALASRIVDRPEAYRVLEAFTFESDKKEAKEILAGTAPAPECDPSISRW